MNSLYKLLITLMSIFSICFVHAEEIFLECQGANKGTDISESFSKFSIKVDTDSGDIYSYPSYIMGGVCVQYKSKEFISGGCKKSDTNFTCQCSSIFGSANYKLSRISLNFDTNIFFKNNETWQGKFQCIKAKKQL